jgi:hypothetical protein
MRTGLIGIILAMTLGSLWASSVAAASKPRTVTGRALSPDGEPLRGADVQIKNLRTLHIRSFVARKDGSFYFHSLHPEVDLEIFARFRDRSSPVKTVIRFDSHEVVKVDLEIPNEPAK